MNQNVLINNESKVQISEEILWFNLNILKVVSRNTVYENQPDYLIILAHNFKRHIIESLKENYKGRIIVMLPEIEVN